MLVRWDTWKLRQKEINGREDSHTHTTSSTLMRIPNELDRFKFLDSLYDSFLPIEKRRRCLFISSTSISTQAPGDPHACTKIFGQCKLKSTSDLQCTRARRGWAPTRRTWSPFTCHRILSKVLEHDVLFFGRTRYLCMSRTGSVVFSPIYSVPFHFLPLDCSANLRIRHYDWRCQRSKSGCLKSASSNFEDVLILRKYRAITLFLGKQPFIYTFSSQAIIRMEMQEKLGYYLIEWLAVPSVYC